MGRRKHDEVIEIGLRLPHSQGTLEFMKRHSIHLYLTLLKINGKDRVEFSDVMILEGSNARGNYYSCSLCVTNKIYSVVYGQAKKHFKSHPLNIDDIIKESRIDKALKFHSSAPLITPS